MDKGLAAQPLTRDMEDVAHAIFFNDIWCTQVVTTFNDSNLALNARRNAIAKGLNRCPASLRNGQY